MRPRLGTGLDSRWECVIMRYSDFAGRDAGDWGWRLPPARNFRRTGSSIPLPGRAAPITRGRGPCPRAAAATTSASPIRSPAAGSPPRNSRITTVTGPASWYGEAFHRRMTSNGEWFDMKDLTAAHPTLPLPSYVKVTNLDNGRELIVRVNDRGPFVGTAHHRYVETLGRSAWLQAPGPAPRCACNMPGPRR